VVKGCIEDADLALLTWLSLDRSLICQWIGPLGVSGQVGQRTGEDSGRLLGARAGPGGLGSPVDT
jgi:hypothetical protein